MLPQRCTNYQRKRNHAAVKYTEDGQEINQSQRIRKIQGWLSTLNSALFLFTEDF
jgi:hypothetical protein